VLTGPVQVPDGVFDHRVAAVVSLELESVAAPVGHEAVIGVVDQQGQLRSRGGLDSAHDQADQR
jgi:hypothetical protein